MNSAIHFPCYVIGLMSGTSADGVDAALLYTDGREVVQAGASVFVPYAEDLRRDILALMRGAGDEAAVAEALTDVHITAVEQVIHQANLARETIALIGFHGQTIRHAPHEGVTLQIGDAARMAQVLGIPVVADFRSADVRAGGQGAPLVPLYHAALAHALPKPVMVVNIGGVSNVTWIGEGVVGGQWSVVSKEEVDARCKIIDGSEEKRGARANIAPPASAPPPVGGRSIAPTAESSLLETGDWRLATPILACDCGPGNALLDDWVFTHTGARYDQNGELAAQGVVDGAAVARFLADPFFALPMPKSLDRNHFTITLDASPADGAATLTAMTAAAIAHACSQVPEWPAQLLITGGGRHNPTLMRMMGDYCAALGHAPAIMPVEAVGWDGDMLEAQAFAYLAARSVQGLPLSLPTTTGVSTAMCGGVLWAPL